MLNDYEREHNAWLRENGGECAVLLKSDGSFPLEKPCTLALFGSGARHTVKGGTGSGEVNSRFFVNIEDGLRDAGFAISSGFWLDSYDALLDAARKDFYRALRKNARKSLGKGILEAMGVTMPEPDYNIPLRGAGDAAVYVLARNSGEGTDRQAVPGDLLLTETETRDILALQARYPRFLLVLNVGGVVDLSPVLAVKNFLLLSQLGVETGSILADLLLGKSVPSGKLSSTWSAWEDYAGPGDFGDRYQTRYREGIYVGYRYFDAAGRKPLFPFGFGLGYTQFALRALDAAVEGETVTVRAEVKNTGAYPGKEVAQLYVSAPQGRLGKAPRSLAAFAKSSLLQSGERETLTLSFALADIASYDTARALWLLEKGDYILRLGTSSADTKPCAVLRLDADAPCRKVKNCFGSPDFADWQPALSDEETPAGVPVLEVSASSIACREVCYEPLSAVEPEAASLTDEELAYMSVGAFKPRQGALSVIGNAGQSVAGAAGETCRLTGFPGLVMADGPAGLRLSREYTVDEKGVHGIGASVPESLLELLPPAAVWLLQKLQSRPKGELHEQYCTAIPIGTALAQSWNPALAEGCGDLVGDEMERFGVQLWLAPALNIHRDVRCGRNFEYFSEDPLLSGVFAAAVTRGVQRHPGCGTTIKHFAANNQERNRYNSNSQVSERALREIYLRGFAIAVRDSQPHALMSSYNLLNGVHTAERFDLIEDTLRGEFGFEGIVMTDWVLSAVQEKKGPNPSPSADRIAAAGNDLTMPGGMGDVKAILAGLKAGTVTRHRLEVNVSRVLRMAKALNRAR